VQEPEMRKDREYAGSDGAAVAKGEDGKCMCIIEALQSLIQQNYQIADCG
jgi:hypothetical protein